MKQNLSPMMKEYLQTKEQYKDCILLYRLGDFYEMFFEDAETASRVLDLTLTGRSCGLEQRAPMCGVPYHAVDMYVGKLIAAGYKVAICEQLTPPSGGKELVKRDVVRVITAGTVVDSDILDDSKNNYIASVCLLDGVGVAICDLSTGEFCVTELSGISLEKDLQEFLVSYKPAEVIANEKAITAFNNLDCIKAGFVPAFSQCTSSFEFSYAKEKLLNHYKVKTLEGFGLGGKKLAVCAAGSLLEYMLLTQKRDLPHLSRISFVDKNRYMSIDVKTRKNLELTVSYRENKKQGSLLWLLDKTETSMGARMLADWVDRPLQKASQINARLDGVDELLKNYLMRANLSKALHGIYDIVRLAGKVAYNNVTPKDCVSLKYSLMQLPSIKQLLKGAKCNILQAIEQAIDPLSDVTALLDRAICDDVPAIIKDSDFIKEGYNDQLDELYDLSKNGSARISALEELERQRTGIKSLKLGYNKVFGYYFEITNSFLSLVPQNFIRKQTLVGGERFVSPELKELEEKMLSAMETKAKLQKSLFEQLRNTLLPYIPTMQRTAQAIASLDCLLSLATVAQLNDYCKPRINTKNTKLDIIDGRHPVVEKYLKRDSFITNDTHLDTEDNRTMVITGPNMAGKSTFMRQVALITLMAHIGSFVPAKSAEIPIVDKIFTRVGASDDLAFNQSTFMVEMVEVANILNNATKNSLIVLDEVGRGTSTFDGLSIAWAVMEFVSQKVSAKTLFATHYHELTDLEGRVEGVKNYRINVKEYNGSIIFLHKIVRGSANKSFGIEVAGLAGVPDEVCSRAKQIVAMLEASSIEHDFDKIDLGQTALQKDISATAKEITAILRDIDINRISPIEAFDILNSLVTKVKNNG